jgi:hypothetical protein
MRPRMIHFLAIHAALLALLGMFARGAYGQTATGTIDGTITDAKGAAMAAVNVVVHNDDTGIDTPEKTNDAGFYTAPLLQPGTYDVTATQAGFATVQNKGIQVQVGQTIAIDFQMPVASQQSLVTVTTEAPLIETEKTEQSQNVSEDLVSNLPTSSRRWEQFVFLTPGVAPDGSAGLIAFHGINSLYNNNSVDGANNNNEYNGGARGGTVDGYVYSQDSIREFQVGSNNFTVEVGQAAGGAVNAVTKSGTSQFHGDLFYNGRSANFNAFDPVAKIQAASAPAGTSAATPTQAVHQQDQYGGSLGGPLIKDKLFFFVTYDGYRKVTPLSVTTNQLSPGINTFGCPQVASFEGPFAGGVGSAPGGGNISQAAMTAECTAAQNYIFGEVLGNYPRNLRQDVELAKFDYQLNQANHLDVVANIRDWHEVMLGTQAAASSGGPSGGGSFVQDRFVIANWDTVISSDKVNEVRYQWGIDHTFPTFIVSPPGAVITNLFNYGGAAANPEFTIESRNQFSDNFSFTKGSHQFKTGVDFNLINDHVSTALVANGQYSYSGVTLPAGVCPTNTGNETYCDWILDLYGVNVGDGKTGLHYTSYSQYDDLRFGGDTLGTPATTDQFGDQDYAAYFQDSWKARPTLTLNLGLRYDIQIQPQPPNPNNQTPLLSYYTDTQRTDTGGVQPRIGGAWNFAKNTVLRAGFGVFFAKESSSAVSTIHRDSGTREISVTCTPATATAAPIPGISDYCAGLKFPAVVVAQAVAPEAPFTVPGLPADEQPLTPSVLNPQGQQGCLNNPSCGARGLSPDLLNPRAYEAEAAFERQLPGNISFTASYIFTRGTHLPTFVDENLAPSTETKTYDVLNSPTAPTSTLLTTIVPLFTTRIDPTTGAILAELSVVNSMYNAMVLTIRRPISHGVEILANYTLSEATDDGEGSSNTLGGETFFGGPGALNPYDLKAEQGNSGIDSPNRFTASVVWQSTPIASTTNKIVRGFLAGWNLSGSLTVADGTPYSALISSGTQQCAVVAASCPAGDLGLDGSLTGTQLSTAVAPIGGRISWMPRNSFFLPSYSNMDLQLAKQFTIHERYHFELRGDAFNLFNTSIIQAVNTSAYNYVTPSTTSTTCPMSVHANTCLIPSASFQTPTTTTGSLLGPRQLQAGIRFEF